MLRAKIDRGVKLRPWLVTAGWSGAGWPLVCAWPVVAPGPRTIAPRRHVNNNPPIFFIGASGPFHGGYYPAIPVATAPKPQRKSAPQKEVYFFCK
jgi:hypothetical protein